MRPLYILYIYIVRIQESVVKTVDSLFSADSGVSIDKKWFALYRYR